VVQKFPAGHYLPTNHSISLKVLNHYKGLLEDSRGGVLAEDFRFKNTEILQNDFSLKAAMELAFKRFKVKL